MTYHNRRQDPGIPVRRQSDSPATSLDIEVLRLGMVHNDGVRALLGLQGEFIRENNTHCSSAARVRTFRFSSRVTTGRRSYPIIQGS